jgi:SAM-dependent methyltransferase
MLRRWLQRVADPVVGRVDAWLGERVERELDERPVAPAPRGTVHVPPVAWVALPDDAPFMASSTCSSADIRHPRFAELCDRIGQPIRFHRKQWEFAFIVHHLVEAGMIRPGRRGLGFGVGKEPLPAAFAAAGCTIVATDAPPEVGEAAGWIRSAQFADSLDRLRRPEICDDADFDARVTHRAVDMNELPDDLTGFDFLWSACCIEHLGSLRHGADFVVESVERCLRPGGVAVHTTEFNMSSDEETYESPELSIYRRCDIDELVGRLEAAGHAVHPFRVASDDFYLDHVVDVPPFHGRPHLKLELAGHVATSAGLVVTRAG